MRILGLLALIVVVVMGVSAAFFLFSWSIANLGIFSSIGYLVILIGAGLTIRNVIKFISRKRGA